MIVNKKRAKSTWRVYFQAGVRMFEWINANQRPFNPDDMLGVDATEELPDFLPYLERERATGASSLEHEYCAINDVSN